MGKWEQMGAAGVEPFAAGSRSGGSQGLLSCSWLASIAPQRMRPTAPANANLAPCCSRACRSIAAAATGAARPLLTAPAAARQRARPAAAAAARARATGKGRQGGCHASGCRRPSGELSLRLGGAHGVSAAMPVPGQLTECGAAPRKGLPCKQSLLMGLPAARLPSPQPLLGRRGVLGRALSVAGQAVQVRRARTCCPPCWAAACRAGPNAAPLLACYTPGPCASFAPPSAAPGSSHPAAAAAAAALRTASRRPRCRAQVPWRAQRRGEHSKQREAEADGRQEGAGLSRPLMPPAAAPRPRSCRGRSGGGSGRGSSGGRRGGGGGSGRAGGARRAAGRGGSGGGAGAGACAGALSWPACLACIVSVDLTR